MIRFFLTRLLLAAGALTLTGLTGACRSRPALIPQPELYAAAAERADAALVAKFLNRHQP